MRPVAALAIALVAVAGCGGDPARVGEWSGAATVQDVANAGGCSTAAVGALSAQLIAEQDCIHPGILVDFSTTPGLTLGSAVEPYLEPPAADGLAAAAQQFGADLQIDSAFRTLAQQYLLYEWYQMHLCGISLAAVPGNSNHETGIAVDVGNYAAAMSAMQAHGFTWFGSSDPVHFDYTAGGTIDLRPESVLAFQRLWNLNNPNDTITEDGQWGPMTEARLAMTSAGGFAIGSTCQPPPPDASVPRDSARAVDAADPVTDAAHMTRLDAAVGSDGSNVVPRSDAESGCSCAIGSVAVPSRGPALALVALALSLLLRRSRRRARA